MLLRARSSRETPFCGMVFGQADGWEQGGFGAAGPAVLTVTTLCRKQSLNVRDGICHGAMGSGPESSRLHFTRNLPFKPYASAERLGLIGLSSDRRGHSLCFTDEPQPARLTPNKNELGAGVSYCAHWGFCRYRLGGRNVLRCDLHVVQARAGFLRSAEIARCIDLRRYAKHCLRPHPRQASGRCAVGVGSVSRIRRTCDRSFRTTWRRCHGEPAGAGRGGCPYSPGQLEAIVERRLFDAPTTAVVSHIEILERVVAQSASRNRKATSAEQRIREKRVYELADECLVTAQQTLSASTLLTDDLWLPVLEDELAFRKIPSTGKLLTGSSDRCR